MVINDQPIPLASSMERRADDIDRPLLNTGAFSTESPPAARPAASSTRAPRRATPALRRLRRAIALVITRARLERCGDVGHPPRIELAWEHAKFFLPKGDDGKLLPLRCSEREFSAHVGPGVSLYMQFQKRTGYMFAAASVVCLPQFIGNWRGGDLAPGAPGGPDPYACPIDGAGFVDGLMTFIGYVMNSLTYFLYSTALGNAAFSRHDGVQGGYSLAHLVSELLLCMMFCVYVYWIWQHNQSVLSKIDAAKTTASDFGVVVKKLPHGAADAAAVKAHFSFFGDVASAALSVDNRHLLALLRQQGRLHAQWRTLHVLYAREARAAVPSRKKLDALVDKIEAQLCELVRGAAALRQARAHVVRGTGQAFVVFRRADDAARCVRHFELIRRQERARDGSADNIDFRQLYYRGSKLEVARASEPSDVIWENLGRPGRWANLKTTAFISFVACISTFFIAASQLLVQKNIIHGGIFTTVGQTAVLILSNVVIFIMVPQLAINVERHHYRTSQHTMMLMKMAAFQIFNTVVACLIYIFFPPNIGAAAGWAAGCPVPTPPAPPAAPPPPAVVDNVCFASLTPGDPWSVGFLPSCVHGWYTTGGFVLMNTAFGDLTAILIIIEWIRPDKWIFRLLARRQPTQQQMNNFYTLDSDLYLPFRYQLILKWVFLTLMFCPAFPLLLPYGAVFCLASYCVDRYNLLRVFKPPPRTTDRTISMSVLYILPLAVFAHIFMALFFYSKQVGATQFSRNSGATPRNSAQFSDAAHPSPSGRRRGAARVLCHPRRARHLHDGPPRHQHQQAGPAAAQGAARRRRVGRRRRRHRARRGRPVDPPRRPPRHDRAVRAAAHRHAALERLRVQAHRRDAVLVEARPVAARRRRRVAP